MPLILQVILRHRYSVDVLLHPRQPLPLIPSQHLAVPPHQRPVPRPADVDQVHADTIADILVTKKYSCMVEGFVTS